MRCAVKTCACLHAYLQWQHQVRVQVVGVLALPAGARSIREARVVLKGSLKEAVGIMFELKQDTGLVDMQQRDGK